ncbi:hypothetical protein [Vampirovibrio sp.]|uniref:hypothetical protein n=1 Tax=Vampirovibrio sp. TaxID=2717857 RepID=UPI00359356CA
MRIEGMEAAFGPNIAVQEIQWFTQPTQRELDNAGQTLAQFLAARARKNETILASSSRYNGNPALTLDLRSLVKLLRVSSQKLRILRMLRRGNWLELLRLMPKELLVNALRLFNKEKLVRLLMNLPKPMLIKLLLKIFKLEELIQKMPTVELMRILKSKRLNNRELSKGILTMDPRFILQLLQKLYGNHDYSHLKPYDLMRIFMHTPKERLIEAFKTLPFKALQPLVTGFVKKDPALLLSMSDGFIFKLLDKCPKPTIIESCRVLPEAILIKLLAQLPDHFLMLAAAQIDDKTFEDYLIARQGDLIRSMAA